MSYVKCFEKTALPNLAISAPKSNIGEMNLIRRILSAKHIGRPPYWELQTEKNENFLCAYKTHVNTQKWA